MNATINLDKTTYRHIYTTKSEVFVLQHLLLGLLLYTLGYSLNPTGLISKSLCQLIQSISLVMICVSSVFLLKFRFENKYLAVLFTLYMIWELLTITRGWAPTYNFLKLMLFSAWFGVFIYFSPLIMLLPRKLAYIHKIFQLIVVLCFVFLFFDVVFIGDLLKSSRDDLLGLGIVELFCKNMSITAGFLLLTYPYHSKKVNFLALFVMLITIFLALLKARRGLILMSTLPLFFTYLLLLSRSKTTFITIFLSFFLGALVLVYGINFYTESSTFDLFKDRALEDSRTGVEVCFFNDMDWEGWIFGRGVNGMYSCPEVHSDDDGYRWVIETDYLNVVLKGGLISLVLFLLMAVPAMILGIFRSKNTLCKAAGIWILMGFINMYPSYIKTFTFNYLFIWLSIGICYSKVLRNMDDNFLKQYFRGIKTRLWDF